MSKKMLRLLLFIVVAATDAENGDLTGPSQSISIELHLIILIYINTNPASKSYIHSSVDKSSKKGSTIRPDIDIDESEVV